MANLGMADSLIIMVIALVVFGPRRLPQIGRQIGKLMYEFRKASNDFKFQMEEELRTAEEADRRKKEEERLRSLALTAPASQVSESRPGAPTEPVSQAIVSEAPAVNPGALNEIMAAENSDGSGRAPVKLAAPLEHTHPRILPPSTGEQVAAARPNSPTALEAKEPDAAADPVSQSDSAQTVASEPEQAAHHG
jgi:sec-independent protein translocase protein TatB